MVKVILLMKRLFQFSDALEFQKYGEIGIRK